MSIWWSLHLRREAASVPLARRLLLGAMETAGVDPDTSYDLSLALGEACANAVEHAGEKSAEFRVTAYLDDERCCIEVADSGPGFPSEPHFSRLRGPVPADAENGRGLRLIEELADHVHFGNRAGRSGAVVSFDKSLKWRPDAPLTLTG
ncbi:ATP-binding protein [Streptomyces sp. MUM 203J]|uniref:ATP-binding protein n=1 Tax=Streptomyces sp. MUM 203J TaxID=2791990 RepID=UPI001F04FC6A|nr:ATP-binding protein [Streptomyces sp. MUM 203J]MCH0538847.1 ATP-binding protein [Streptomyces sp. MUM 203J]